MKKIYTIAGAAFFLTNVAFAQQGVMMEENVKPAPQSENGQTLQGKALDVTPSAPGDTIWSEDFASGFPATWKKRDISNLGLQWTYETAPSITCTYTNLTFASTTAANGYMLLFSDKYNADVACTILNSQNPMDSYMQTPAINCTGKASVELKFQHAFRYCCNSGNRLSVFVSTDTVNWTEFSVKGGLNANVATANPDLEVVNISSVAANQATVYIRWHAIGNSHYYWTVDDIAVTEGATDDMKIVTELVDFNYTDGRFYTQVPKRQATNMNINFRAAVENNGANNQTGVNLNVKVKQGATVVYDQTSPSKTVNAYLKDTLIIATPFMPGDTCTDLGDYTFDFSVTQNETDQNPANSMVSIPFKITDSVFARDYGVSGANLAPDSYTCCQADGSEVGTLYEFTKNETATSISVFVLSSSDSAGISVFANLYRLGLTGYFASSPIAQSNIYDITTKDLGQWVTIPFTAPVGVEADSTVLAAISVFGYDAGFDVNFGGDIVARQAPVTSFVYGGTWGWINGQPMIRLNMDDNSCTNSVNEVENSHNLKIYPNPSQGVFTLTAQNLSDNNTTIEVHNVIGQTVYSKEVKSSSTSMTQVIDISDMDKGVYFVKVINNNEESIHKIVVQ